MRMRFMAVWAACLLALTVVGCGKKGEPAANPTEVREFHAAIQDGDAEIVERLLKAKPYLANAKSESGETPLKIANQRGNEELADVLKRHGAKE
jgi:hypothetical protein